MKKIISILCTTALAIFLQENVQAQVGSLAPSVIGSTGGFATSANFSLSSNTGECIVNTASAPTLILTQGFEQPTSEVLNTDNSCGVLVYSGLTPNGDGHNDLWVIDFVDLHPENTMEIYNRWGALIWKGTNYDNGLGTNGTTGGTVWNGKDSKGVDVPDGTYYFIFTTPDCSTKGWVEVSH